MDHPRRASFQLADSPWFWIGLFGLMGVIGLAVIGPKYIRRQQRLDLQQETREQIYRQRVAGKDAENRSAAGSPSQPSEPPVLRTNGHDSPSPASDARAKLRFWTLMALTTGLVFVSWSVLAWQIRRRRPVGKSASHANSR